MKEMEFKDRIIEYRESLGIKTQKAMAERLGLSRQLYSNLESGYKNPSRLVLEKLVEDSNMPEEYWLYGVDEKQYVSERKEFKCLYAVLEDLKDTDLLDLNEGKWNTEVEAILLNALKADISHMRLKEKLNK